MTCNDTDTNTVAVAGYRGDTIRLAVELTDTNNAAVNITGWTWASQVRSAPDSAVLATMDVLVTDAPGGTLELSLDDTITAAMAVGDYVFDLQATDVADDVRTLISGALRIRADVTT